MKICKLSIALIFVLTLFNSCSKEEKNDNISALEDFCNAAPKGWQCEIMEENFNEMYIPKNAPTPIAIIKYTNPDKSFTTYLETTESPSLILDVYPAEQKNELVPLFWSQQLYSWCIPIYYGENDKYFVLTSPCFINGGSFTDEANSSISDLNNALKSILTVNNYND